MTGTMINGCNLRKVPKMEISTALKHQSQQSKWPDDPGCRNNIGDFALSLGLSSFQNDQFCVSAISAIFAHEDVLLATGNAIATAIGLLNLIAPICGIVVKQLHFIAVDVVSLVDERTLQYIQVVDVKCRDD